MTYKVVFRDGEREKVIIGQTDFLDPDLLKIVCKDGKTIYVNKNKIIWMREL